MLARTGAVARNLPTLKEASAKAVLDLWESMRDVQVVVWLDNWYRKRYGTDPIKDMSLNVSAMAVLHIQSIPVFPGYLSFTEVLKGVVVNVRRLAGSFDRLHSGISAINREDLRPEWIRVPLDVQRSEMRSLQWLPYVLTEETVSSQLELLGILDGLQPLQNHTRRTTPV